MNLPHFRSTNRAHFVEKPLLAKPGKQGRARYWSCAPASKPGFMPSTAGRGAGGPPARASARGRGGAGQAEAGGERQGASLGEAQVAEAVRALADIGAAHLFPVGREGRLLGHDRPHVLAPGALGHHLVVLAHRLVGDAASRIEFLRPRQQGRGAGAPQALRGRGAIRRREDAGVGLGQRRDHHAPLQDLEPQRAGRAGGGELRHAVGLALVGERQRLAVAERDLAALRRLGDLGAGERQARGVAGTGAVEAQRPGIAVLLQLLPDHRVVVRGLEHHGLRGRGRRRSRPGRGLGGASPGSMGPRPPGTGAGAPRAGGGPADAEQFFQERLGRGRGRRHHQDRREGQGRQSGQGHRAEEGANGLHQAPGTGTRHGDGRPARS